MSHICSAVEKVRLDLEGALNAIFDLIAFFGSVELGAARKNVSEALLSNITDYGFHIFRRKRRRRLQG